MERRHPSSSSWFGFITRRRFSYWAPNSLGFMQTNMAQEFGRSLSSWWEARKLTKSARRWFRCFCPEMSERINGITIEASEVSKTQWERRDRVIVGVRTGLQTLSQSPEVGVVRPIRETLGVTAGLRAALGTFVGHHSKVEPKNNLGKRPVVLPLRSALLVLLLAGSYFMVLLNARPKQETS